MNKKVVVIGGGYGGLRSIEFLAKRDDIDITLIDQHPYHYLQTEAYGYIALRFDLQDIALNLEEWCGGFKKKVDFICDSVVNIDFNAKNVHTCYMAISYDYLIIATGARTNFFKFIEGLREYSYGVKSIERAHNFRKKFEDILYNKLLNKDFNQKESINLAIGGAGLSGVEVAAEMANALELYKKSIGFSVRDINIYLIDASSTILQGMSSYIINHTKKRLEALNVKILTDAFIDSLDSEHIYFRDATKLKYHFMIFTGGIKASWLNDTIDTPKNKIFQFIPTQELNIVHNAVYAIGDCVELRDKRGDILPPTAQVAELSAEFVAKNIIKKIDNKPTKPFRADVLGIFIALGGKYAVGEIFGFIKVKGYMAYLLKKAITKTYYLGIHLRINAGFKNRKI